MATTRRVRLSSKGQLVIPQEMREDLGLEAGDELILHRLSDRLLLAEVPQPSPFEQAAAELREEARKRKLTPAKVREALAEARQESHRGRRASRSGA